MTVRSLRTSLRAFAIIAVIVISAFIFGSNVQAAGFDLGLAQGAEAAQGKGQPSDLFGQTGTFRTLTNVLLFLIGAISVIMLIVGGLRYVVSGGDSGAVTNAKNTILYAIVGIVVAILAYAVVSFVINSFSGTGVNGAGISAPTNT